MQTVRDHLASHSFRDLFIEELGWDIASGDFVAVAGTTQHSLRRIAHKRGVQAFTCELAPEQLTDRKLLRAIESQLSQQAVEHVAIYFSERLRQQCWQWAAVGPSGKRLRHREHPFTSRVPSEKVVARIQALAIAFEAEDTTSLSDVSARLRTSFDNDPEFSSFFRGARWRVLSDALHRRWLQTKTDTDLNAFLSIHLPLLPWAAKKFAPRRMDPEDAAHIAFFALRKAAQKFDPDHGAQFSTYATKAMMQWIGRFSPVHLDMIKCRSPRHSVFRQCERRAERLAVTSGEWRGHRLLELLTVRRTTQPASVFRAVRHIDSLDDPSSASRAMLHRRQSDVPTTLEQMLHEERIARIPAVLAALPPRDAAIVQKRFGLDGSGEESTLEEIGAVHGLTKERVRQVLVRVIDGLRERFDEPTESETAKRDLWISTHRGACVDSTPTLWHVSAPDTTTSSRARATPMDPQSASFALTVQPGPSARLFETLSQSGTMNGTAQPVAPPVADSGNPATLAEAPASQEDIDIERVQAALRGSDSEGGMLVTELIVALGAPGGRVRRAVHFLAKSGEAVRGADLRWRSAPPPRSVSSTHLPTQAQPTVITQPSLFGSIP